MISLPTLFVELLARALPLLGALLCFYPYSSAYALNMNAKVDLELGLWSRLVSPQKSYPSQNQGIRLGGDHHFKMFSKNFFVGASLLFEEVSYKVGPALREGIAIGLAGNGGWAYDIEKGVQLHLWCALEPLRTMSLVSRESGDVNGSRVERVSLSNYSEGFGFELGSRLQKSFEFWIFKTQNPLFLGAGLSHRIDLYQRLVTKTLNSQKKTQESLTQNTTTMRTSLMALLTLGIHVPP